LLYWDTHRYGTGSGSDLAPLRDAHNEGTRSLPLPVLYRWRVFRFNVRHPSDNLVARHPSNDNFEGAAR
jgi:hypothetical protein